MRRSLLEPARSRRTQRRLTAWATPRASSDVELCFCRTPHGALPTQPVEKRRMDALVRPFSTRNHSDEGVQVTFFNRLLNESVLTARVMEPARPTVPFLIPLVTDASHAATWADADPDPAVFWCWIGRRSGLENGLHSGGDRSGSNRPTRRERSCTTWQFGTGRFERDRFTGNRRHRFGARRSGDL